MDRDNIQTILPLTGPQEALLIHELQSGFSSANIQTRFSIEGAVDDAVMAAAWQDVVARHETLRALIHVPENRKGMLVVTKAAEMAIETVDLTDLDEDEQERRIAEHVAADAAQDLPLRKAPVGRLTIFRRDERRRDCLWTVSKVLVDGWSAIVVLRDVMSFYQARCEAERAVLPPVPSLQSYVAELKAVPADASRRFWGEMFAGYRKAAPVFRTLPGACSEKGRLPVPAGLWDEIKATAVALGVSPAALVCSAWAIFNSCCGAGSDVAFALSVSGRSFDFPGIDAMVGSLATTTPRRAQILSDMTVAELAKAIHQDGLRAQPHEALSPIDIFGGSDATRDVPVPETLLTIETLPDHEFEIPAHGGVRLSEFRSDISSGFPVTLVVIPGKNSEIHYSFQGLADPEFARLALAVFPALLKDVATDPELPVQSLLQAHKVDGSGGDVLESVPTGPHTPAEMAVAEIWKDVLGVDGIDMDRDFASQGGRSFDAVRVLTRINEAFGTDIPLDAFIRAPNIPAIARLLTQSQGVKSDLRTLVPFRIKGARTAILFVHLGAFPVTFLKPLFDRLEDDRPFLAVQPVGVGTYEKPLRSFDELAHLHVSEFESLIPNGPVNVIGMCGGARLAVEVVRQLRERGRDVRNFIAIDSRRPSLPGEPHWTDSDLSPAQRFRKKIGRKVYALARACRRGIRTTYARGKGDAELRLSLHSEFVEEVCLVADQAFFAKPVAGKVFVIQTRDEKPVLQEWQDLAEDVIYKRIDVGHFTMFFEPEVDTLAEEIRAQLDEEAAKHAVRS